MIILLKALNKSQSFQGFRCINILIFVLRELENKPDLNGNSEDPHSSIASCRIAKSNFGKSFDASARFRRKLHQWPRIHSPLAPDEVGWNALAQIRSWGEISTRGKVCAKKQFFKFKTMVYYKLVYVFVDLFLTVQCFGYEMSRDRGKGKFHLCALIFFLLIRLKIMRFFLKK